MCRPMFHVREVVSAASEVLGSSSPYALVMPEALACRRTVLVSPDRVTCCTWNSALRRAAAGSQKSRRPLPAELERLTYVSPIDSDTLAKRTTQAAYVLILVWARDRRPARRHGKSSSMAHIGRGVADDAGAPMTTAYGADDHSHQRAASAEGSESQGGRSSAIVARSCAKGCFKGSPRIQEGVNALHDKSELTHHHHTSTLSSRVKTRYQSLS